MKNKHHIFSQLHSDTRLLTASHVGCSSKGSAVAAGSNRTDICRRLAWQWGRVSAEGKSADRVTAVIRVTEMKGDDGEAGNRRTIHTERLLWQQRRCWNRTSMAISAAAVLIYGG
ncbi:hypothetical protein MHYP_G00203350 [Metynnis hypsauchen]